MSTASEPAPKAAPPDSWAEYNRPPPPPVFDLPPDIKETSLVASFGPNSLPRHEHLKTLTLSYPDDIAYYCGTLPGANVTGKLSHWFKVLIDRLPALRRLELKPAPEASKHEQVAARLISGTFHIRTFSCGWQGSKLHIVSYRPTSALIPLGPHDIKTHHWECLEGSGMKSPDLWAIPSESAPLDGGAEWYYLADSIDGPIGMDLLDRCLKYSTQSKASRKRAEKVAESKGQVGQAGEEEPLRREGRGEWLPDEVWEDLFDRYKEKEATEGEPALAAYWKAQAGDDSEDERD